MYSQLIRKQGDFNLFKTSILFFIVSLYPAVTALHQSIDRGFIRYGYKPGDWSPTDVSSDSASVASLSTEK